MMVGCTELKKMVKVKFKLRAHPSAVTKGKPDFGVINLFHKFLPKYYDGNPYWVLPRCLVFVIVISRGARSQ